jgi:hypothetical protein
VQVGLFKNNKLSCKRATQLTSPSVRNRGKKWQPREFEMSWMWRLRIWQYPTIGRVFARTTRWALTSEAGAKYRPSASLNERSNAVSAREPGLWRTIPADTSERGGSFWRKFEDEARAIAAGMTDPHARLRMLLIAEYYGFLADRAELRKSHKGVIRGSRQHVEARRGDAVVGFVHPDAQQDPPRVTSA